MHLSLLSIVQIVHTITLIGLVRRGDRDARGYLWCVAGTLLLAILAQATADHDGLGPALLGTAAVVGSLALVLVPWLLEQIMRWCFSHERVQWAVRLAAIRSMLMIGSGAHRQLPLMMGLGIYEKSGPQAALRHFRSLIAEAREPKQVAAINEQVTAMLFSARRWQEGVEHYQRWFSRGHMILRPGLALGLIRAYGELRRLDDAAELLEQLESAREPAGREASPFIQQARLTLLAYAGECQLFERLEVDQVERELGLAPKAIQLYWAIALHRAGQSDVATARLSNLNFGATKAAKQVREAAEHLRAEIAQGPAEPAVELDTHMRQRLARMSEHILAFLARPRPAVLRRDILVTRAAMVPLVLLHCVRGGVDASVLGSMQLGSLTTASWELGAWISAFSAPWLQPNFAQTVLDLYLLWIAGPVVERLCGRGRVIWVLTICPALGLLFTAVLLPHAAGAGSTAVLGIALVTAALWFLLVSPAAFPSFRSRRNFAVVLVAIAAAKLWGIEAQHGLDQASCVALAASLTLTLATVATSRLPWLSDAIAPRASSLRWITAALSGLSVLLPALAVIHAWWMWASAPGNAAVNLRNLRTAPCQLSGLDLQLPGPMQRFRGAEPAAAMGIKPASPRHLQGFPGVVDELAAQNGDWVRLQIRGAGEAPLRPELERTFTLIPDSDCLSDLLRRDLDHEFADLRTYADQWRCFELRLGGELAARMIQRRVSGTDSQVFTASILATPDAIIGPIAARYLRVLASAEVAAEAVSQPRNAEASSSQPIVRCWPDA